MQEEERNEENGMNGLSVEELFLKTQATFDEAQQLSIEESSSFNKTEFFRMDKLGVYRLRVMPLAPNPNGSLDRKSYQLPVHQLLMELEKPTTNGKASYVYVSIPRAIQAGFTIDLIDTYRKLATVAANEKGDEKLSEMINSGSYNGGLKYSYDHALYITDLNERAKGLQLLFLSHAQYCDLNERRMKLWQKKLDKNANYPCPISSVYNAYPVEIEKKKNGGKTEYIIEIDNESDTDPLSIDELNKLMAAPRIPEIIYRYSRYHFEATLLFLKQCDQKYGLKVMSHDEMITAIETFKSEIPKEDTSSFSFEKRSKETKENTSNDELTFDMLVERYDELINQSLGDKTEEGQQLRASIRTYIEQEGLSIRVTRATTNADILDLIENALTNKTEPIKQEEGQSSDQNTTSEDIETLPTRRRR